MGPDADVDVEPVAADTEDGRSVIRHSAAHVLAQAVQQLHPEAKLGIGPPITDGFYYDFDVEQPFTPDDLTTLESAMKKIIKAGQRFSRRRFDSLDDARKELADEPYKLELIDLKGGADAETRRRGHGGRRVRRAHRLRQRARPHRRDRLVRPVPRPARAHHEVHPGVQAHAHRGGLLAGQREEPAAAAHLRHRVGVPGGARRAPAPDRRGRAARPPPPRRRAGPVLLPRRDRLRARGLPPQGRHRSAGSWRTTRRRRHEEAGYEFVNTPHITKGQLFETSGHLAWYAEGMYPPMHLDAELDADGTVRKPGQDYYLKPMNCPMHNLIFRSRGRSYRELPLRLFEFGTVYRYEKSGVVHGLTRARGFTQDDAHIYCTHEQMQGEIRSLLQFVLDLLRDYGLDDFYLELSTRNPEKSIGSDEDWERATDALREAAEASGLELVLDPGGAAFYAPKISVQAKDAIGRTWQMSTIQVDLMLPERFGLEYTAPTAPASGRS